MIMNNIITGELILTNILDCSVEAQEITCDFETVELTGILEVGGVIEMGDKERYIGETTILPKVQAETELQTRDKLLDRNIKVLEIPYYETSNPFNGKTFIIGTSLEVN